MLARTNFSKSRIIHNRFYRHGIFLDIGAKLVDDIGCEFDFTEELIFIERHGRDADLFEDRDPLVIVSPQDQEEKHNRS
jgi:hypothetical protein